MDKTCGDYARFKERLDQLRKVDDNIILRLNSMSVRDRESCQQLRESLRKVYEDRSSMIRTCLEYSCKKIAQDKAAAVSTQRSDRDWEEKLRASQRLVTCASE